MRKILITGASGYLAHALVPIAAMQADVIGVARNLKKIGSEAMGLSLDIEDRTAVMDLVRTHRPDAIIHCAACNPGSGNDHTMFAVNESGSGNVADAASEFGCRLVSVSSDTVFDGNRAPFADDSASCPLPENAYAVSKARGEDLIISRLPSALIVRTSLIYGLDQIDRGTEGFANRLKAGDTLKLFTDVIRQPMDCQSLSRNLCALALDHPGESGFINMAGDEAMSRYTFGVRMLEYWGIEFKDQVEQVSGSGIKGLPLDLRVTMGRAKALGLPTPGLSDVIAGKG